MSFKITPTLLAGLLIASSVTTNAAEKEFKQLPEGSFPLTITQEGKGVVPHDKEIYLQFISTVIPRDAKGDPSGPAEIYYAAPTKDTVKDGPNPAANGAAGTGTLVASVRAPKAIDPVPDKNPPLPSFKLSELVNGTIVFPGDGKFPGGRLYMSMGKPLKLYMNQTGDGYVQPDENNPTDVNRDTQYDFVEFTYNPIPDANGRKIPFGGNLTQVDQFAIPLSFKLHGVDKDGKKGVITRGITLDTTKNGLTVAGSSGVESRDALIKKYKETVDPAFKDLFRTTSDKATILQIQAPYKNKEFLAKSANYYTSYVDEVWKSFASNPRCIYDQPDLADGQKVGNKYCVTIGSVANTIDVKRTSADGKNTDTFSMNKPSTEDIFRCDGELGKAGDSQNKKDFGALLCASLNRHTAERSDSWLNVKDYYEKPIHHSYSDFWHDVSIGGLAYGFGYDDIGSGSSVAILPYEDRLSHVEVSIGW